MFPVLLNASKRSLTKNYRPVSLLSVVRKVFEKLVNNRIVDHQINVDFFLDFHYGVRSSWSTADLLTVASDKIARAFDRSRATRTVLLKLVFFTNLSLNGISVEIFGLISTFPSNRQLRAFEKSSQEYPVHAGVSEGSILGPTLFLPSWRCYLWYCYYADDATLCSKCDQASDLWQKLEFASELE